MVDLAGLWPREEAGGGRRGMLLSSRLSFTGLGHDGVRGASCILG